MQASGVSGSKGIAPLINQARSQAKMSLKKTQAQMERAEAKGAEAIKTVLKAALKGGGVGQRLDVQV